MAACEFLVPCGLTWTYADLHMSLMAFLFFLLLSGVRSLVLCVIITLIRPYSLYISSLLETYIFSLPSHLDAAVISHIACTSLPFVCQHTFQSS